MDLDFHYWITGLIAVRAGFSKDESSIIATSSQLVDENVTAYTIKERRSGRSYTNLISQTVEYFYQGDSRLKIFPLFHYLPDVTESERAAVRKDGKNHPFITTPNSDTAQRILDAAFQSTNGAKLYRIGIATHSFTDAWAHQNFVGYHDHFNNLLDEKEPRLGHSSGAGAPDWIGEKWTDHRLVSEEVDNGGRFLEAARELFLQYCRYLGSVGRGDNSFLWDSVESELVDPLRINMLDNSTQSYPERLKHYQEVIDWLPEFKPGQWLEEAVEVKNNTSTGDFFWREGVHAEESRWYYFQESIREHEQAVFNEIPCLNELFPER